MRIGAKFAAVENDFRVFSPEIPCSIIQGNGIKSPQNIRPIQLLLDQRAEDLMMGAPSEVSPKQLRELHIRVLKLG